MISPGIVGRYFFSRLWPVLNLGSIVLALLIVALGLVLLISPSRAQSTSMSPSGDRLESSNRQATGPELASSVYASALNQYQTGGDEDLAITNFKFCIAVDPDFAPPYQNLAEIAFHLGDITKAVYWAQQYVCLNKDAKSTQNMLIELHNLRLLAVLTREPAGVNTSSYVGDPSTTSNTWKYLAMLGNFSFRRGEYQHAQIFYRAALGTAPSEESGGLTLAIKQCEANQDFTDSLKQARAEAQSKHYEEAFQFYLRAHKIVPENKDCLIEAIANGLIAGRYVESQKLFAELLLHLKPDDARRFAPLQQRMLTLTISNKRGKDSEQRPKRERKRPTLSDQFLKHF
jgi:tetratricopeptide (TPR) repeat protein